MIKRFFTWFMNQLDIVFMNHGSYVEDKEFMDVREFNEKFGLLIGLHPGHVTKRKLMERIECMQEELDEFRQAVDNQYLPGQADALIDLAYFAKGTAVMLGLPWAALWDDVHDANMTKKRGVTHRGHRVDLVKPKDWIPPQTSAILRRHGYRRSSYTNDINKIDERLCRDDVPTTDNL